MKMKSFALLAVSGLLASALGYAVPAMADDMSSGGTSMQATTPSTTDTQNQNNAAAPAPSNDNSSNSSTENPTSGSSSSDEGNPDTPSGDDDY